MDDQRVEGLTTINSNETIYACYKYLLSNIHSAIIVQWGTVRLARGKEKIKLLLSHNSSSRSGKSKNKS